MIKDSIFNMVMIKLHVSNIYNHVHDSKIVIQNIHILIRPPPPLDKLCVAAEWNQDIILLGRNTCITHIKREIKFHYGKNRINSDIAKFMTLKPPNVHNKMETLYDNNCVDTQIQ
jgi:hypothetical protein